MAGAEHEQNLRDLYFSAESALRRMNQRINDMYVDGKYDVLERANSMLFSTEMVLESIDAPKKPDLEVGIEQQDGSTAYVRIWDNAYEINGHKVRASRSVRYEDEVNTLKLFLTNPGQPFLVRETARGAEFLDRLAPESRVTTFSHIVGSMEYKARGTNLFTRGSVQVSKGRASTWVGFDIDPNLGKQVLLRKIAGNQLAMFSSKPEDDRKKPEIVIYENGYEMGDEVYLSDASKWASRNRELLLILINNAGKKLAYADIVDNTDFMHEHPRSVRLENARAHLQAIRSQTNGQAVIQKGRLIGSAQIWHGVGIEEPNGVQHVSEVSPQSSEQASPPEGKPVSEHVVVDNEGLEVYVRIWDNAYDLNGQFVALSERDRSMNKHRHEVLRVLLEHKGRALSFDQIINETDFLSSHANSTRHSYFLTAFHALEAELNGTGLLQSGRFNDGQSSRKWQGIGISTEVIESMKKHIWPKPPSLEEVRQRPSSHQRNAAEPVEEIDLSDQWASIPKSNYDLVIDPVALEKEAREQRASRKAEDEIPIEDAEEEPFDFTQLRQLVTSNLEKEIIEYIIQRAQQSIDITDLVRHATPITISGDTYERKIFPALQARASSLGLGLTFSFSSINVSGEKRKFLEIS